MIKAYGYVTIKIMMNRIMLEKINNLGSRPGPTQTGLYNHRRLEACCFRFKKKRDYNICVVKTKMLINCAVTAQLICAFIFPYALCWYSYAGAQIG